MYLVEGERFSNSRSAALSKEKVLDQGRAGQSQHAVDHDDASDHQPSFATAIQHAVHLQILRSFSVKACGWLAHCGIWSIQAARIDEYVASCPRAGHLSPCGGLGDICRKHSAAKLRGGAAV